MSGGKGGETTTEIPPEFKQRILKAFDRGDQLSRTVPLTYTGITQAAPSEATKSSWNQTNDMANLLGLGMASGKPTDGLPDEKRLRDQNGIKGYDAHWGYVNELQRQNELYPQQVAGLNNVMPGLLSLPSNHQPATPSGPSNPGNPYNPYNPYGNYNYDQIAEFYRNGGVAI